MAYVATWITILDVDDFDPVDAARHAVDLMRNHATMWGVEDLTTGEDCSIDLSDGRIIYTEEI